jgi:hypothetical protein
MRLLLALVAALLVTSLVPAAGAAATPKTCDALGGRTTAANAEARLFVRGGVLRGCTSRRRGSVVIPGAHACDFGTCSTAVLALSTRNVAYAAGAGDPRSGQLTFEVRVVSLLTGRVLRRAPAVDARDTDVVFDRCEPGMAAEQRCRPAPLVPRIVIARAGVAAWTVDVRFPGSSAPPLRQVRMLDASGARTLASGPGVDVFSLAGADPWAFWLQDGRAASARLG